MINVFYRLLDEDGKPTEFMGFASAKNGTDLFWLIDEFCDPYRVELLKCTNFGICIESKIDHEIGCAKPKKKKTEFSGSFITAINEGKGWIKPEIKENEMIIRWKK